MAETEPQAPPALTDDDLAAAAEDQGALDEFDGDDIAQYIGELIPEGEDPNDA